MFRHRPTKEKPAEQAEYDKALEKTRGEISKKQPEHPEKPQLGHNWQKNSIGGFKLDNG